MRYSNACCGDTGTEISPGAMWDQFQETYLPEHPSITLRSHELATADGVTKISAQLLVHGEARTITGTGNGPIDAFVDAIRAGLGADVDVVDYQEHSIGSGAGANAVAYVETVADGVTRWGVGVDPNIIGASFAAVLSAVNRMS